MLHISQIESLEARRLESQFVTDFHDPESTYQQRTCLVIDLRFKGHEEE